MGGYDNHSMGAVNFFLEQRVLRVEREHSPPYNTFGQTNGEGRDERRGMAKEIFCSIGIDIDAVAGWLGSYGGEDSPDDISRGMFSGEVGTPRLLKLFDRYDLRTT
jgi:hypothetical protein